MTIYCVAKNYAKHAAEMGDLAPSQPVWFLKPESAILPPGGTIQLPADIGAVHHEVEWAVRIGPDGPDAMTVAIDLTARDLQAAAKQAGRPWTQAKGFQTFLPLGRWVPFSAGPHELRLSINGSPRQEGNTAQMIHSLDALLAHAKSWTTLQAGDILVTGTPEGVGPIAAGERIEVELVGHCRADFIVGSRD